MFMRPRLALSGLSLFDFAVENRSDGNEQTHASADFRFRALRPEVAAELANELLSLLSNEDQQLVFKECEPVSLEPRQTLIEADEPVEHVYFPLSGIVSVLAVLNDCNAIEAATIGNDGFAGLSTFLGSDVSPVRFIVQVRGEALRIPSQRLHQLADSQPQLRLVLGRYADFVLGVTAQTAACNRLHNVVQRCARWLLRVHDRLETNEFPLTQEFLAHMLGVRRASVSIAAGQLQDAGYIRYSYARVAILDKAGLESAACECLSVTRRRYETMVLRGA